LTAVERILLIHSSPSPLHPCTHLQMFEGLLCNQLFFLVPFHSVHDTGPQETDHCWLWQLISFHFFFYIKHYLEQEINCCLKQRFQSNRNDADLPHTCSHLQITSQYRSNKKKKINKNNKKEAFSMFLFSNITVT